MNKFSDYVFYKGVGNSRRADFHWNLDQCRYLAFDQARSATIRFLGITKVT